jgi:DNA mismatch repair protein MutL
MYNRIVMNTRARIQILPESVASAIAAGEVIERPASVIKELVENALDAGATKVEILVDEAGMARMEVQDNGYGILAEDVALAVERYATSKLRTPDDLFNIHTLGFRGEALSSIAAVSRLELTTRSRDEPLGTRLTVEGGELLEKRSIGAPPGTIVGVRDLFYNVPARRKFVKTPRSERQRIKQLIHRLALAYPAVAFRLAYDGRVGFESSGSGDKRELLAQVFTLEIAREMIALQPSGEAPIKIRGFVSPPHISRSNRLGLTFFVNGRWVQDASLATAVVQAYHTLLMVGRFPISVIYIDIPAEQVDVNVHPAKSEVRFRDPQQVFSLVQRAVRATLLGQVAPPRVDLQDRWQGEHRGFGVDWQFAEQEKIEQSLLPAYSPRQDGDEQVPLLRLLGQVSRAFLIAEGPDGIYLIDQHAAHERILFEQYLKEIDTNVLESQALLEPLTIELGQEEIDVLRENEDQLKALGFELEEFGGQSYRLRAIPSMFTGKDPEEAIRAIVEDFEEDETPLASRREASD